MSFMEIDKATKNLALALLITSPLFLCLFYAFPTQGVDWYNTFYKAAQSPLSPYNNWSMISTLLTSH